MERTGNIQHHTLRADKAVQPESFRGLDQRIAFIIGWPKQQLATSDMIATDDVHDRIDSAEEPLLCRGLTRELGDPRNLDEQPPTIR